MNNFFEEQEMLKKTAANLLMYVHQREQSNKLRNISMEMGVSNTNASTILNVFKLLGIDRQGFSRKMETQLNDCIKICQGERELKGSDTEEYFKTSLQTVSKPLHRICKQCGGELSGKNKKAKFCSDRCRVENFRNN